MGKIFVPCYELEMVQRKLTSFNKDEEGTNTGIVTTLQGHFNELEVLQKKYLKRRIRRC